MNNFSEQDKIKTLLNDKMKVLYDRKLESILAMYSEDVVTFDFKAPLINKGIDAVKKRLQEWFTTYKTAISQEIKMLEITVAEDAAFSHCLTRTYGTSSNNEKQDMWYRTTNGFKKINGKWLITHEHVSDPVDMETGKAMFDLKP